jgi:hypothetical protein
MPKKKLKKPAKAPKKLVKPEPAPTPVPKKPARRYVRRNTYYLATAGKDASILAPQPRVMVEAIQKHGRVERKALMRELAKALDTIQPITRLFSFHRAALMRRHFFKEVKEPIGPMLARAPQRAAPALAIPPPSYVATEAPVVATA